MRNTRIIVVVVGIILPYAVRLPRGITWFEQYIDGGFIGFLLIGAFNAVAWGAIVGITFLYRWPKSVIAPSLFGFGFLAWAHYSLDLAADAQAAIALAFIPIYALLPIAIGGLIGYVLDRRFLGEGASPLDKSGQIR
jgi:hypothetical protein